MAITGFTAVPSRLASRQELVETTNTFFSEVPQFVTEANEAAAQINADKEATIAARDVTTTARDTTTTARDVTLGYRNAAEVFKDSAETAAAAAGAAAGLPSLVGKAFSPLLVNAAEDGVEWGAAADYQEFTESGTYTVPPGATSIFVYAVGAGASGVRFASAPGGIPGEGIGKSFRAEDLPATIAITIGAGGEWVAGSPEASVEGGDTTFGAYLTAFGGRGRTTTVNDNIYLGKRSAAATGGFSSAVTLAQAVGLNTIQGIGIEGTRAPNCIYGGGVGGTALSGANTGGDSVWAGAGGDGSGVANANGTNGNFPGGGGGSTTTGTGIPGNGADGVIRIWAS